MVVQREGLLAPGRGVDDELHMEDYAAHTWRFGMCVLSWWFIGGVCAGLGRGAN